jgi:hypothetical protein
MRSSLFKAFAAAATMTLCTPLAAQASGGVRIIVQAWQPSNPATQNNNIVLDRPGLLEDGLNAGWAKARTPICAALERQLGKADLVAPGFSLYNMDCKMAGSGTLDVTGAQNNVVTLQYRLPGNMFRATSTQPSVAGSYADPCAFFYYDLVATTSIHLDTLAVDTFSVATQNVSRPDSCNAAGDIAKFVATTIHFFGGPDFLAIAQNTLTMQQTVLTGDLNAAVKTFVAPLRSYAGQYAKQSSWVRHGDLYFAFAPSYVPQPLSATLNGRIVMPKARWHDPAPDCSVFRVSGNVQTGPAPILDPESMRVGVAPHAAVGAVSAGGVATDAGDRYVCSYAMRSLPPAVPVAFQALGRPNTSTASSITLIAPDGWSGTDVLPSGARDFLAVETSTAILHVNEQVPVFVKPAGPVEENDARRSIDSGTSLARVALNPQPLPPSGVNALISNGNAAFARGDFSTAAALFGRAVATNQADPIALHNLALVHARLGNTSLAHSELRTAQKLARGMGDMATANAAARSIIIVGGATP